MNNQGSLGHRLYTGQASFDIVGKRKTWYILSGVILAVAIGTLGIRGLNLGIEFKGGAEFSIPVATASNDSVTQARKAVQDAGKEASSVTIVGGDTIRVQTQSLSTTESNAVNSALAKTFGVADTEIKVQLVGPSWGSEVSKNAARALAVFLVLVALFLAIYFEWPMALAGLVALAHDVVITVGIYALSGFEVTPATVVGFLTILGYSLYDTVVVFDKVRENTKGLVGGSRMTYSEASNLALNQTLARSINTSLVALLPVLSILIVGVIKLGPGTLNDLALALFVGMLIGTYSSIFIATPILASVKERQPEMQSLAKRVHSRRKNAGQDGVDTLPVGAAAIVHSSGPRQQRVRKSRSKRAGK
jgi:preprotein translocase subunit SecF